MNFNTKLVLSIIVPVYNAEKYIGRCLNSVYNQGVDNTCFEIKVIKDGSTDSTSKIVESYSYKYGNLRIIKRENGGVSTARNTGINQAQGDYILFLDADDELIDESLIKVIGYLQSHEVMDMLVTRQTRFNGVEERVVEAPSLEEHYRYNGVEAYRNKYVRIDAGGGICRLEFLKKYNIKFPDGVANGEDTVFFVNLQVYAESIVYYNIRLYRIYEVEGSASRNDVAKIGKRMINTMNAVADIKQNLDVSREQKGIFDYAVYQLLSNTIACYVESSDLSLRKLKREVNLKALLPLDTDYMYLMRKQASLMNFSLSLFCVLNWIKYHLPLAHHNN